MTSVVNPLILKDIQRIIMDTSAMWLNALDKDANVIAWNKAAEQISGFSKEEVLGSSKAWELIYPDEAYRNEIYVKAKEIIDQGKEVVDFETTIRCKDGGWRRMSWNSHDIKDDHGETIGSLAIALDITELYKSRQELKKLTLKLEQSNKHLLHLSEIDELTGLYNQRYMANLLTYEWKRHIRNKFLLSIIYIDIDFFKEYNDTYGHNMGDKALSEIATVFQQSARRSTDKIIRFGGEEFALILPETNINEAMMVAQSLMEGVLLQKIEHLGSKISNILTVSIGVACIQPSASTSIETLKLEADNALYKAKNSGRNRIEKFE